MKLYLTKCYSYLLLIDYSLSNGEILKVVVETKFKKK